MDNNENTEVLELDLSHFNTSNVTHMNRMFAGARLHSLDLTGWDVSNVVSMAEMFGTVQLELAVSTDLEVDSGVLGK